MAVRREVETFLDLIDNSTHRLAFALGLRYGLRSSEIVLITSDDLANDPAGDMMHVQEKYAKFNKYRETPVLAPLASYDPRSRRAPPRAVRRPPR